MNLCFISATSHMDVMIFISLNKNQTSSTRGSFLLGLFYFSRSKCERYGGRSSRLEISSESPKPLPKHCCHCQHGCSILQQCDAQPVGARALVSPQAPLCLSSRVPGICTLAGAPGAGQPWCLELGAMAPASPVAVTSFHVHPPALSQ